MTAGPYHDVTLFAREVKEDATMNLFSVAPCGQQGIKYRSVVYHTVVDNDKGCWNCDRDGKNGCIHITRARDHLQQLIQQDLSSSDSLTDTPGRNLA